MSYFHCNSVAVSDFFSPSWQHQQVYISKALINYVKNAISTLVDSQFFFHPPCGPHHLALSSITLPSVSIYCKFIDKSTEEVYHGLLPHVWTDAFEIVTKVISQESWVILQGVHYFAIHSQTFLINCPGNSHRHSLVSTALPGHNMLSAFICDSISAHIWNRKKLAFYQKKVSHFNFNLSTISSP